MANFQDQVFVSHDFFKKKTLVLFIHDSPDVVLLILDHKADVNAKDKFGRTPLMFTAQYTADPDVVRLLIEHGAEVNAIDHHGWTPLMYAQGHPDSIALLKQAGARE